MREILRYLLNYLRDINRKTLVASSLFTGLMIFLNYYYGIDDVIERQNSIIISFIGQYLLFLIVFTLPYLFCFLFTGKNYFKNSQFFFLVLLSPAIFSAKMAMNSEFHFTDNTRWNEYWNQVLFWPLRLVFVAAILFIIWKTKYGADSFFGFTTKNFSWRPYLFLLLLMIPLIAAASFQPEFLRIYPKLNNVTDVLNGVKNKWFFYLLFELSYGSDLVSVELFFRGFLVLAFIKFAGKDVILPMACFYCAIHFGKPLAECISSYFGGIFLGIIVYNTKSIYGALVVHLGLAWLMELGGYIGNLFIK